MLSDAQRLSHTGCENSPELFLLLFFLSAANLEKRPCWGIVGAMQFIHLDMATKWAAIGSIFAFVKLLSLGTNFLMLHIQSSLLLRILTLFQSNIFPMPAVGALTHLHYSHVQTLLRMMWTPCLEKKTASSVSICRLQKVRLSSVESQQELKTSRSISVEKKLACFTADRLQVCPKVPSAPFTVGSCLIFTWREIQTKILYRTNGSNKTWQKRWMVCKV